jgi:serine/threonine-protein kinase
MAATEPDLSEGAVVLGKLRVVRNLGQGGIGAVYEVEHELTRHRRALKVLHPRFREDKELVERFLREASAAGRIGNAHIVETFDAGKLEDGSPFLLMELLQGEPLTEVLRREGRLEVGRACALLVQCCESVAAAHEAGIVHRDLKPDNLFVTTRDGRPFVKVLDFGISKFDADPGALGVTATGIALGTPLYMAPEQMRGAKNVDARADVYSLGVVLYECLAGGTPYGGDSFAELAAQALTGKAVPLDERRSEVPAALSLAVHRAMAVNRDERFTSPRELAAALGPFAVEGTLPQGDTALEKTAARSAPARTLATPVAPGAAPVPSTPGAVASTPPPAAVAPAAVAVMRGPTLFARREVGRGAGPVRQGLRGVLLIMGVLALGRTVWSNLRESFPSESRARERQKKRSDERPPDVAAAIQATHALSLQADAGETPTGR